MYGMFTYIWLISIVHVGKNIPVNHGWYWDTHFNQHILRKFLLSVHIGTCVSMVGKEVRVSSNELLRFGTSWENWPTWRGHGKMHP